MIVAKGIREAVRLVRQCRDLAKLNRLQDLKLMPQIFHLLAPFMEMLLRWIFLRHHKRHPRDLLCPTPRCECPIGLDRKPARRGPLTHSP